MASKFDAVAEAIENADIWMNGAVVVKNDSDDFDAIPGAYLSDVSYTGSREVVVDLGGGLENSTGYSFDDGSIEELAMMLV